MPAQKHKGHRFEVVRRETEAVGVGGGRQKHAFYVAYINGLLAEFLIPQATHEEMTELVIAAIDERVASRQNFPGLPDPEENEQGEEIER